MVQASGKRDHTEVYHHSYGYNLSPSRSLPPGSRQETRQTEDWMAGRRTRIEESQMPTERRRHLASHLVV